MGLVARTWAGKSSRCQWLKAAHKGQMMARKHQLNGRNPRKHVLGRGLQGNLLYDA